MKKYQNNHILPQKIIKFSNIEHTKQNIIILFFLMQLINISMILVILYVFLNIVSAQNYISSFPQNFPFKIGNILLRMNGLFLNGTETSLIDPQTHSIMFTQDHLTAPDSILVSLMRNDIFSGATLDRLYYSFIPTDITKTGFTLKSKVLQNVYQTVLLGYLTITNGFGFTLIIKTYPQFTFVYNRYMRAQTNIQVETEVSALTFINTIDVTGFTQNHNITLYYFYQQNNFLTIYYDIQPLLPWNNLSISIISFNNTKMSEEFQNNNFLCYISGESIDTASIEQGIQNQNSETIYFMSGLVAGYFQGSWRLSLKLDDNTLPYEFNTTYIKNRNLELNKIEVDPTTKQNYFAYLQIRMQRCNKQAYSFLMYQTQRCYDVCPNKYYSNQIKWCIKCQKCTSLSNCPICEYSMCASDQYYNFTSKQCIKCNSIDINCVKCFRGLCDNCSLPSLTFVDNNLCVCKNETEFLNSTLNQCIDCPLNTLMCQTCFDQNTCLTCLFPRALTSDNTCLACEYPYLFKTQTKQCKQRYSFALEVFSKVEQNNVLYAFIYHEYDLKPILQNYRLQFFINNVNLTQQIQNQSYYHNNTMKIKYKIQQSIQNPKLQVKLIPYLQNYILYVLSLQKTLSSIFFRHFEQDIYDKFGKMINKTVDNSGTILSALTLTSLSGIIVGILWTIQIASYYLFLPIQMHDSLIKFLNSTVEIQNIKLFPFEIPDLMESYQTQIKGRQIYEKYDVDLYFIRQNSQNLVFLAGFSILYFVLYLCLKRLQAGNWLTKYIKYKFVNQVYQNISLAFYSIITCITFSAAASLTSEQLFTLQLISNNFSSVIALFIVILISILHPIILYLHKTQKDLDNQECYLGFEQKQRHSQYALLIYLMFQLVIPMTIPLLNHYLSISVIVIASLCNVVILIKCRLTRLRICTYYRLIGQFSFILFNLMLVVYEVIIKYFPRITKANLRIIGLSTVGLIALTILIEMIEILTDTLMKIIELIKQLIKKIRKSRNQRPQLQSKYKLDPETLNNQSTINHKRSSKNKMSTKIRKRDGLLLNLFTEPDQCSMPTQNNFLLTIENHKRIKRKKKAKNVKLGDSPKQNKQNQNKISENESDQTFNNTNYHKRNGFISIKQIHNESLEKIKGKFHYKPKIKQKQKKDTREKK